MNARRISFGVGLCLALVAHVPAQAQGARDPTQAPPEAGLALPQAGGVASAASSPHYSVIVQDGQARLVVGTRLVAPGGMVGDAKLERITETEVWLRKGKELRKVPRFAGIQRTTAGVACPPPLSPAASSAASAAKVRRANAKSSLSAGAAPSGCAAVQP